MLQTTSPRLRRLAADYESVRERFSGHPHVRVDAVAGQPPHAYRVMFNLRGLRRNGTSAEVAVEHVCDVELPLSYPREAPHVVAVTPVFHPNIAGIYCVGDYWAPAQPLADVIEKIGDMIQWRTYNVRSALDPVAAAYGERHPELFPIGDVSLRLPEPAVTVARKEPVVDLRRASS